MFSLLDGGGHLFIYLFIFQRNQLFQHYYRDYIWSQLCITMVERYLIRRSVFSATITKLNVTEVLSSLFSGLESDVTVTHIMCTIIWTIHISIPSAIVWRINYVILFVNSDNLFLRFFLLVLKVRAGHVFS